MEAKIVGFKRSHRVIDAKCCIITTDSAPASLIGKSVRWETQTGKILSGRIIRTHGKYAALARFSRGLPGNAVGSPVQVGTLGSSKVATKKGAKAKVEKKPKFKKAEPKAKKKKPEKRERGSKKAVKKDEEKPKPAPKKKAAAKKPKAKKPAKPAAKKAKPKAAKKKVSKK